MNKIERIRVSMNKKLLVILLTCMMMLLLTACTGTVSGSSTEQSNAVEETTDIENTMDTPISDESTIESDQSTKEDTLEAKEPEDKTTKESNTLVAYFSATHTTEGVAKIAAEVTGADLYEITPEVAYTEADLDYHDDNSRTTLEMNDPSARPAISGSVSNMEQYDIVFVGYPIWWGEAPRIISTFLESYDFSGKIIVPFCTSGGSDIGSSASNLEKLTDGATWKQGKRLDGNVSKDEVSTWIIGLGLDYKFWDE